MPLRAAGNSRWKAFGVGCLSGSVEPVGGALVLLLASAVTPLMPYLLAFAAGAMLYVVIEELISETAEGWRIVRTWRPTAFASITIRSDFTPPVVEPAIPHWIPMHISKMQGKIGQVALSAIAKPLVEA